MTSPDGVPDEHGGDGRRRAHTLGVDVGDVLDLSASLHPAAPSIEAVLRDHLAEVRHYPNVDAATAVLADALGVPADRLLLTNGGAEAIALVAGHLRCGWVVDPEFSLYRRHLAEIAPHHPRWRSNPSNPLGALAALDADAAVWDEAFYPIATGRWTRGDRDSWRIGSLTKLWAAPGLRLGYAIAPSAAARDALMLRQPRWSVSSLALAAVEPMLARTDLAKMRAELDGLRDELVATLTHFQLVVEPTSANWVLVHGGGAVWDHLESHGVFVRDCTSFGLSGIARLAIPDAAGIARVRRVLESVTRRAEASR